MDVRVAAADHDVERKSLANRKWSPVVFALDRLFPKHGRAPYATAERVVALAIIRAMSFDESVGAFNCFLSYPTIARWSGVSIASVKRALQKHGDGPAPLISWSKPGHTRGHKHACYRFTLVRHPEKFARARDVARSSHDERAERAMGDLQPERIALQRQRQDFGGFLTDHEYRQRLATLERAARSKRPARAGLKRCVVR